MDPGQLVGLVAIGVIFVLGMWTGMIVAGARRVFGRAGARRDIEPAGEDARLRRARLEGERIGYARALAERGVAQRERGRRRRYRPAA